jgi:hypothetical protein
MAVRYMRDREPMPTITNLRRRPAAYVLAAYPTAATPAVLRSARRSIVDSLIYISPTAVLDRSAAKIPQIQSAALIIEHAMHWFAAYFAAR